MANSTDLVNKVPLRGKIGYALTDGSGNLLISIVGSYLLYYYTDVLGLSVAVTGTLLLMTRMVDAIDVPIWGFIVDHTTSKYGQSRPYFLWLCVPFSLCIWLTFTSPGLSGTAKVAYAATTYILTGIIYSGIQTSITSILSNLTNNAGERVILNTCRMIGGNIGGFISMTFTIALVGFFGNGNNQRGFSITVGMFSIIAIVLFLLAFANLREVNTKKLKKIPIRQSIRAVKGNWPWVLLVIINLAFWIGFAIRLSTSVYYCQYYLGDKNLVTVINGLVVTQLIGVISIPFVVKHVHKYGAMILGLIFMAIGHIIMFLGGHNVTILISGWVISSIAQGIAVSMPFVMLSDAVDFGEWKTGIRASGFLTAIGSAFCIKAGQGLGGFLPAVFLNFFGYIPNVEQTATALVGVQFVFIWLPTIFYLLGIIPLVIYRKYEQNESIVLQELAQRQPERI